MFDNVEPFVSRDDISLGALGAAEIQNQLAQTSFGIIVVTRQNQAEPWLNFEAGALAKTVTDGTTSVVPLLIDMSDPSQLRGPMSGLQSHAATEAGVRRLVNQIGDVVSARPEAVDGRWAGAWAEFSLLLDESREHLAQEPVEDRTLEDMVQELLALTRNQARARPAEDETFSALRDHLRGESFTPYRAVSDALEEELRDLDVEDFAIKVRRSRKPEGGSTWTAIVELPSPLSLNVMSTLSSRLPANPILRDARLIFEHTDKSPRVRIP
ncbi:hypothetical protein [Nocardioides sp. R-C-SC26]|uniref:hypothetical protein n=1 Tax=Nocardioides sp. R-C-SC26 TaxID=2870414 RepID=UPI0035ABB6A1